MSTQLRQIIYVVISLLILILIGKTSLFSDLGIDISVVRSTIGYHQPEWRKVDITEPADGINVTYKDFSFGRRLAGINAGLDEGLYLNQAVLNLDGGLVGLVSNITSSSSEVTLLNDNSLEISVKAGNSTGVVVSERGSVKMILLSSVPKFGEKVVTDGVDGVFPPGLVVGVVENLVQASAPFEGIFVSITTDLSDISKVKVYK